MDLHYRQWIKRKETTGAANNVICCVLAEIYYATEDEHIKVQCRRAAAMAKAMSRKLSDYKQRRS